MTTPAGTDAIAHVFVASLDDRCRVDGDDGHHLQRVRRVRAGEHVTAADNTGAWREYAVADAANGALTLDAIAEVRREPAPRVPIELGVAPTKAGLESIVAAVTELGVARITPVQTARTVVRWDDAKAEKMRIRFEAIVREAAMQSRRARIPEVNPLTGLAAIATRPNLVLADRAGEPPDQLPVPDGGEWTVLVGPEGGFDDPERNLLASATLLSLGSAVLRATTAPIAAVAVLAARVGAP